LKGKIFKFMSDILKDGSYYKLCTQAKSTSACGLPKGFFLKYFCQQNQFLSKVKGPPESSNRFIHFSVTFLLIQCTYVPVRISQSDKKVRAREALILS